MTIQVAVLCDAATDYNSKLNLLGTFDTILAAQLPAQHPQCSVALRIAFDRVEEGAHRLSMNFVDEDGQPIMPVMDVPIEIVFPSDATFMSRNFVVNIQQLKFKRPDFIRGRFVRGWPPLSSIPLAVKMMEEKNPANPCLFKSQISNFNFKSQISNLHSPTARPSRDRNERCRWECRSSRRKNRWLRSW